MQDSGFKFRQKKIKMSQAIFLGSPNYL